LTAVRKQFEQHLYDAYDDPAKKALIKILEETGHRIMSVSENYYADVVSEYEGETFHSEGEVKRAWKDEWPTSWKEIRIPERKTRLLKKYNNKVNFYVFNADVTKCWFILGKQMTQDTLRTAFGSKILKGEKFFHIPYTEAKLITL
jgi:hypothetical protein